jgi:hypothetical protein
MKFLLILKILFCPSSVLYEEVKELVKGDNEQMYIVTQRPDYYECVGGANYHLITKDILKAHIFQSHNHKYSVYWRVKLKREDKTDYPDIILGIIKNSEFIKREISD